MGSEDDATVDAGRAETLTSQPPSSPEAVALPAPFEFRRELSRGGMGRVLIAFDHRHGREVAIKIMRGVSPDLATRFRWEAQVTARLQHPAIVPVYDSGLLPDGEPFYAMRLVSGRSLDRTIENRRLPARLALLPQLIAAVDAIAYAHANHVVHRDLKPQNILVGRFGETVVIDWGLAKDLVAVVDAPIPHTDSGPIGLTMAGQVIGTPAYMPPEQARGHDVDERADVYSLGAVIYHVLAGNPPFDGPTSHAVLAQVIEGPPPPLAKEVPPDLRAIVDKAMSRNPSARYASAAELADDLKKFQTGQLVGAHQYSLLDRVRRVTARQRAAVAVGATLLLLMMVLGAVGVRRIARERDVANARSIEARTARGAAEALVGYLVVELAERLERLGWIELLRGVGEAVVRYEESNPRSDEAPSAKKARALELVAAAEGKRGDDATAERALRASLEIRRRLVIPGDPATQRALLHAEAQLIDRSREHLGITPEVMAFAAREQELAADAERTTDPLLLDEIASTMAVIGRVRELSGELPLEEKALRSGIAAAERGMALAPNTTSHRRLMAQLRSQISDTLRRAGRINEGKEERTRSLGLFEALVSEHANEPRFQAELQQGLYEAAILAGYAGEFQQSEELSQRALLIIQDLTRRHPENLTYHEDHVHLVSHLAAIAFDTGRYPEAKKYFHEALKLIGEVAAAGFDVDGLDSQKSHALVCLGWIELFDKRPEAAIPPMIEALGIAERSAARRRGDSPRELNLAEVLCDLGYAEMKAQHFGDAVGHLQRAASQVEGVLSRQPDDRVWSERACFAYAWLAESLAGAGRRDEALRWSARLVTLATPLISQPKAQEDSDLVAAIVEGSAIAVELDATPEAVRLLQDSLTVLEEHVKRGEVYASALSELGRWRRLARAHRAR